MRILIAEDDFLLADGLARCLRLSGFETDWVADGQAAAEILDRENVDLLILDLVLPKVSGADLLKRLRARVPRPRVLVISALDSISDRVRGLDLGADDYLPKPFDIRELEARVRALTRRGASEAAPLFRCGSLTYDTVGRIARLDGLVVSLRPRELLLLEALIEHAGRWIGKDDLARIFSERGESLSRNAIEVYMHRLRGRIGKRGVKVLTTRGLGYRLVQSQLLVPVREQAQHQAL